MRTGLDGFNWIARHYDRLGRLVFGDQLSESQVCFLKVLPARSSILVIGGGAGNMLHTLMALHPCCTVMYVEASSAMITLARQQVEESDSGRITFVHGTEKEIPVEPEFDVVITNFLLDVFSDERLEGMCRAVARCLKEGGFWLAADFVPARNIRQRILLWMMYRFFVWTCRIGARRLPRWEAHLTGAGLTPLCSRSFAGGFVKSVVFKKEQHSPREAKLKQL